MEEKRPRFTIRFQREPTMSFGTFNSRNERRNEADYLVKDFTSAAGAIAVSNTAIQLTLGFVPNLLAFDRITADVWIAKTAAGLTNPATRLRITPARVGSAVPWDSAQVHVLNCEAGTPAVTVSGWR